MKKSNLIFALSLYAATSFPPYGGTKSVCQNIGINTTGAVPNASALLDIDASPGNNRGLLVPRVTFLERTGANFSPLPQAAQGLLVYQTNVGGDGEGYYYNTSITTTPAWTKLFSATTGWALTGNAGTVSGTNFIGTTDAQNLDIRTNNVVFVRITQKGQIEVLNTGNSVFVGEGAGANDDLSANLNTFIGYNAGNLNTTGSHNTALGHTALTANTTGYRNTAIGIGVLQSNTTGYYNTAVGMGSLVSNTTGYNNSAIGRDALANNTTGSNNVAMGKGALGLNSTAYSNVGLGGGALEKNTTTSNLVAVGDSALYWNIGIENTAVGSKALYSNTTGNRNTAVGYQVLYSNTTASRNIAVGTSALSVQSFSNAGVAWNSDNVAVGYEALYSNQPTATNNGYANTAVGNSALFSNTIGKYNVGIGFSALGSNTIGNNNTAIGLNAGANNTTGFENCYLGTSAGNNNQTGIYNVYVGGAGTGYLATGSYNTMVGATAGRFTTTGTNNNFIGVGAGYSNTTGNYNTFMGDRAGTYNVSGNNNTAIGRDAGSNITNDQAGSDNTYIGYQVTGGAVGLTNATGLGRNTVVNASNKVRLGDAIVSVIEGQVAYTFPSDGRFKFNVKEEVKGLDFITKLRPVIYQFDTKKFDEFLLKGTPDSIVNKRMKGIDYTTSTKITHTGFIAQEVIEAAKQCDFTFDGVNVPENENGNYGVAYSQFVVPLVKAVQELKAENDSLKKENRITLNEVNNLKTTNRELKAEIEKIKQYLELKAGK